MQSALPSSVICAKCGESSPGSSLTCTSCGDDVLLDGRYRLDEQIGRGAMGITYRATRMADGTTVAVKELPFHRVDTLKTTELFEREATILRALSHPSIPAWFDHFTVGAGKQLALCIVQEFIDGDTVQALFEARRPNERDILELLRELLETLIHLGDLRPPVVHRDIKPQNLMRRKRDGSLVLIDFGSVRDAIRDDLAGGSTVAGTFGYMAPEQFAGHATAATDLFGAGATALALLAGSDASRLLGPDGKLDWQGRVVMSDGLRSLLGDMLAAAPEARTTAKEAHARVLDLLNGKAFEPSVRTARPSPPVREESPFSPASFADIELEPDPMASRPQRRLTKPMAWFLGITIVLLTTALFVLILLRPNSTRKSLVVEPPGPLSPSVAPPFDLAFGMSLAEAARVWPALSSAEILPPRRLDIVGALGTRALDNAMEATLADTPPIPGVAHAAMGRFGTLEARCEMRFASIPPNSTPGLVAFECGIAFERQDEAQAAAQILISQWTERFGPPLRNSPDPIDPAFARYDLIFMTRPTQWKSSEASVEIGVTYAEVSLRGETDAWRLAHEEAQRSAAEAWQRDRDEQAQERQLEIERKLKAVETP